MNCPHCHKTIEPKKLRFPRVVSVRTTKDGKEFQVVREHQLKKPYHRENQTARIPVYYIQPVQS